eukprot:358020-Chlamydomonas_euryale.AAC.15
MQLDLSPCSCRLSALPPYRRAAAQPAGGSNEPHAAPRRRARGWAARAPGERPPTLDLTARSATRGQLGRAQRERLARCVRRKAAARRTG